MKVHHLNCGTMCPLGTHHTIGSDHLVCHCLLIETDQGLVLVDSGLGSAEIRNPRSLPLGFRWIVRPRLEPAETALAQVRRLGFTAVDVRHVVLTHLDLDHAGGLSDFPEARVHLHADELRATQSSRLLERHRYIPSQWAHDVRFATYEADGEQWHGFDCVRQLDGLPPEFLLIPVPGHTRGHSAVAIAQDDGWLVHCGDAYFHRNQLRREPVPPGLAIFTWLTGLDRRTMVQNQVRLGELAESPGIELCSAHDPVEFSSTQPGSALG